MGSYSEKGLGEGGKALLNVRRGQKMSDYALLIRPTRFTFFSRPSTKRIGDSHNSTPRCTGNRQYSRLRHTTRIYDLQG